MNTSSLSPKWTYADLISSYRFWGIVLFYLFFTITIATYNLGLVPHLYKNFDLSVRSVNEIVSIQQTTFWTGFLLAWAASRVKNHYPLYFFGAILALGVVSSYCANGKSEFVFLGQILVGISRGAIFLLIPAYIAGAVKTTEAFALSFGLCYILSQTIQILASVIFAQIYNYSARHYEEYELIINILAIAAPVLIGCLFLLPVRGTLFNEAPRKRRSSTLSPDEVSPFSVFLLFFVPLYHIFWLVRIHRETWSMVKTQRIMTAKGAGWSAILLPFTMPIMCALLNDVLRELRQQKNQPSGYKTGEVMLFSCLFPPIGAAMIQAQMNRLNWQNTVTVTNDIDHGSIEIDQNNNIV